MSHEIISTNKAPNAIGPYCQGIKCGDTIYTSGQVPFIPETGQIVTEVKAATLQVLDNLLAIIEAGGGNKKSIVKMEIFVSDIGDFKVINEVYAEFFGSHRPTRFLVQAAKLPADAILEAVATAYIG